MSLLQVEQDIPAKRSRIDCNTDSNLITSTPQTRGLSNKTVPRGCRKSPNKGKNIVKLHVWNVNCYVTTNIKNVGVSL